MKNEVKLTFSPGDRVLLDSSGECGIVVHTWACEEFDEDCYVAFFGDRFPLADEAPSKPYILRYFATSLRPYHEHK